jgi:hypothetical protein
MGYAGKLVSHLRRPRLLARIVWLVFVLGTSANRVAAYDSPLATSAISISDEAPPVRSITADRGNYIQGYAYARDGRSLYVVVSERAVNVWELGVYYWPEVLGAFVVIILIGSLLAIMRVRHRPRIVGEPYCRHCNYCLRGSEGLTCPECGRETRKREIGRPMWRRLLSINALILVVLGSYGALWAGRVPRTGWVSNYFNWWSVGLRKWAEDTNRNWLLKRVQLISEIAEFETATGVRTRTLKRLAHQARRFLDSPRVSPDGKRIAMTIGPPYHVVLLGTSSGRTVDSLRQGDLSSGIGRSIESVVGFDDSGTKVFVTSVDEQRLKTYLVEWNLETGKTRMLLEAKAAKITTQSGTGIIAAEFSYVPSSSPYRFIEMPPVERIFSRDPPCLRSTTRPDDIERVFDLEHTVYLGHGAPVLDPDGRNLWSAELTVPWKWKLVRSDLQSLKVNLKIVIPSGFHSPTQIDTSEMVHAGTLMCSVNWEEGTGSGLFGFMRTPQGLLIFDLKSKKCREFVQLPDAWMGRAACLAPDGRSCAVIGWPNAKGPNLQLLVYDLSNMSEEFDAGKLKRRSAKTNSEKANRPKPTTAKSSDPVAP